MRIDALNIDCKDEGLTEVTVSVVCTSVDEIDMVIQWLNLASTIVVGWRNIDATQRTPEPESE